MPEISLPVSQLIFIALVLIVALLAYFRVAVRLKIIDRPNQRSSHVTPTIRGGGIIFPVAVLLFFFFNFPSYPFFTTAVLISGAVSFADDLNDLPRGLRFGVHALASALVLYEAGILSMPVILIPLAFIFIIGVINAFNFMDGINGITGFYSIAILLPLMITETEPVMYELQAVFLLSLLVFLFFNARKKAKCFAGDVGSVTIAVIVCFMLSHRVIATDDYKYFGFLALYIVDTLLTIIQRWRNGEKILEAHRRHLFQVLSNEMRIPHLRVTLLYAVIQLLLNCILLLTDASIPGLLLTYTVLIVLYVVVKMNVLKRVK